MGKAWAQSGLFSAPISVAASGNFLPSDMSAAIRASGTITRTLPAIAAVFAGWATGTVENTGTGIVTVVAGAGDALEGVAAGSIKILPKQRAYFYLDTDGWHVGWVDRSPIIGSKTFDGTTSIFDVPLPAGYIGADFTILNMQVDTMGGLLGLRTSTDGGATFATGNSDYYSNGFYAINTNANMGTQASLGSYMLIQDGLYANAGVALTARGVIGAGANNARPTLIVNSGAYQQSPNDITRQLSGRREVLGIINALRFFLSSGKFSSGAIIVRGVPTP